MEWPLKEQEIIVLGSGLGGLIAGTLLAKCNHSVLLFRENGYQPSHTLKGYRFTPFSSISEKCLKPHLLKKISQTLGLPSFLDSQKGDSQGKANSGKFNKEGVYQFILPKARIDIFSQRSLSQKEWKREFADESAQIERFYDDLEQTQHLLQKLKSKEGVSPFFPFRQQSFIKNFFSFNSFSGERLSRRLSGFSREFKELIKLRLTSWGNFYSDQFPMALTAHLLLDELGTLISNFDLEKLEQEILNHFLQCGGEVKETHQVKKVEMKWPKGQTLSLEGDQTIFRSKFLILNAPLHRMLPLLDRKGRGVVTGQERIKPRYVLIPIFLGIHEKVIPVGMKDLLISILDLEKPYSDGNVIFLSLSPKGDERQAPEGRRALTVMSLMELDKWEQTLLVDYQHGVLRHLHHLFPFLKNHIDFVDFQWASEHVPRWSYSHFLYEATSDFHWREGVAPMRLPKKVYFVGKENFPYLGLEGEIITGLMVAEEILKKYS
ncbi:MAG: hypothetical protein HXY44_03015 [Syntrophaceae bacterium]|nr:hypothetical protein [Syntrophaceae bacterium]